MTDCNSSQSTLVGFGRANQGKVYRPPLLFLYMEYSTLQSTYWVQIRFSNSATIQQYRLKKKNTHFLWLWLSSSPVCPPRTTATRLLHCPRCCSRSPTAVFFFRLSPTLCLFLIILFIIQCMFLRLSYSFAAISHSHRNLPDSCRMTWASESASSGCCILRCSVQNGLSCMTVRCKFWAIRYIRYSGLSITWMSSVLRTLGWR